MGQYCFARWRLSSIVVVCNADGGPVGRPPGAWAVGRRRVGRVGCRAERNRTGPPCSVGRPTAHSPGKGLREIYGIEIGNITCFNMLINNVTNSLYCMSAD